MVTTLSIPSLPTLGNATLIQANALTLAPGDYEEVDWDKAQNHFRRNSGLVFSGFPRGNQNPAWTFYKNVSAGDANRLTLIGVHTSPRSTVRNVHDTGTNVKSSMQIEQIMVSVHAWTIVEVVLSATSSYPDVIHSAATYTKLVDPLTGSMLSHVDEYELVHQPLGFILKPVAAGKPTDAPVLLASADLNPVT